MSIIRGIALRSLALLSFCLYLFFGSIVDASPRGDETKTAKLTSDELEKKREALKIAKDEYQKGLSDFKAERYRDALQRFMRVYRINPHPNLVYNMARSFEQLKEYQSAADYYRKYLNISPKAKDREAVEMTISTMTRLAQDRHSSDREAEHQMIRHVAWGGVALGGVMMITGSMFGVRALNRSEELGRFGAGDRLQDFNSVASQRDEAALYSDVFMISGVAITSLSLYFALRPETKSKVSQGSVSLSFNSTGFSVQGAF